MKTQSIKDTLWSLAKPYPRLQGLLMREVGTGTQGGIWSKMIEEANLDFGIFQDVCYEYQTARRKLPNPLDDLIADIIMESRDRKYFESEKLEQHMKHHNPKAGELMGKVTTMGTAGAICITLAKMTKAGTITKEQSIQMLDQAFAFDKGEAERPEWLDDVLAKSNAKNRVFSKLD
jgi:hypothetical protein